jgi:NADPH:quinone reductase-like Zn-dependent oxidoreductase
MKTIHLKAWSWQHKGEPEDLILKDYEVRKLEDHEVLIQNTVIGLNPVDWKLIAGGHPDWKKDHIPGVDGAGIIIDTGKNMSHLRPGSRVCYHADLTKAGSFSTHTIATGNRLIHVPDKISDESAAAFPCPSLTAIQSFQKIPDVFNKKILVSGAGGSVGYFLTQLLLSKGAKVYVTAGEQHHGEFQKMGVIKTTDYKNENWKELMKESLHGSLFDVVFDTVSAAHATGLMELIGYYGHMVPVQGRIKENPVSAFSTCVSLHEIALGAFHKYASEEQITRLMEDGEMLLNKIGNGKLKLREQKINSFENLPQHLSEMKKNNSSTKYLVKV